ncbi:16S rRNA (guanine(527)-N(7))-methyltransferase RsmG [Sphingomonas sp.]|uniref:16S rRNA (guanine(527)-N(7))-methyltransferase RsmG n=1 Tax=Sphingomonas sp. TaxID=28214 RepID=UPI002DD6AB63|nr:16S rRNA (guanine(527)-N(7))-methyltransferase RsmG [Sphingomonas sp.]
MLGRYVEMLNAEATRQNLVAPSTLAAIWSRHIVDSAQLLDHAPQRWENWVDVGSGAGLPGLVIGILNTSPVTLIEPRRLRTEFLRTCATALGLDHVSVLQAKAETAPLSAPATIVSARAVASLDNLLRGAARFTDKATRYILPKGQSAQSEVAQARRSWHGTFHVEQSIVDPASGIVIASGIDPR